MKNIFYFQESDEDIESSEEELDLTKECHPIGYYINNREEMINQMFSVIKGNKLKAMLPPILKVNTGHIYVLYFSMTYLKLFATLCSPVKSFVLRRIMM